MGSLLATQSATSPELAACCDRGLQLCEDGAGRRWCSRSRSGNSRSSIAAAAAARRLRWRASSSRAPSRDGFPSSGHRASHAGQALFAHGDVAAARAALERSLALYVPERGRGGTHKYGQNTEVHTKSLLASRSCAWARWMRHSRPA
jgi:hypothetical protein